MQGLFRVVAVQSFVINVSVCLSVCLFVCLLPSLKTHSFQISPNFLSMLPVAVDRSSNAIRYVLPVLCMTLCFHIMEGIIPNQRRCVCFVQFARWWHQSDVRQRCLVEIARWQHRGRDLSSPTASYRLVTVLGVDCSGAWQRW